MQSRLRPLFVERVTERVGVEGNPLELAFRLLACASAGISNDRDLQTLLAAQCADGGWETCWFYRFGSTGVKAGNRGLTTALAVCAIEAAQRRPPSPSPSAKLEVSGFFSKLSRPSSFRSLRLPWRWTQPTEVAC
ncbi:hypothetical protein A0H81_09209 [Grifola frondosa]|uniref:Uncharacterized protein n=1 Tax=Grifola frondosa TaxID=5627 RepID=A0A1C7M728_GRIFR|nr:hypothetical protein A0H81_09209 [Grifola frondosa]